MMRAPDYQRQAGPGELPAVRQDGAPEHRFLNAGLLAFADNAAEVLHQAGQGLAEFQARQRQAADASRVLEARTATQQAINELMYGKNGLLFKQGADMFQAQDNGKTPAENAMDELGRHIGATGDNLGNDEQRRLYRDWALEAKAQAGGLLQQHEGRQFRVYQRGVGLAAIDTQKQTMALNYNNAALLENGVNAIRQASADLAGLEGYPAEYGQVRAQEHASAALSAAFGAALAHDDSAAAASILQGFSGHMLSEDLLKNRQTLRRADNLKTTDLIAGQVLSNLAPRLQTSDFDRMRNITFNTESAGRQFDAQGQPLTSAKGAKGVGQLLEATAKEAAALAGLPWRPELFNHAATGGEADLQAADYNQALAGAYLQKQLRDFHGDAGLAWAAYNAGPGALRKALGEAEAKGGDWLDYLPKETQAYVAANLQAFQAGEGRFPRPTLAEAQAHALGLLGGKAPADLRKQVLDEVENRFQLQNQALRQGREQQRADAMRALLDNGGRISALPVEMLASLPLRDAERLTSFAKAVAADKPAATDFSLYYKLKTDPDRLRNTNLMAYRDRLHPEEYNQLAGAQRALADGPPLQAAPERDILERYMAEAGIDPRPTAADLAGARAVGRIWSAFDKRLAAAAQQRGGKLNDEDIEKVAARLFTRVGVKGLLYGVNEKPAVLVDWKTDKVEVPDADRRQIIEALRQTRPGAEIDEDRIFYLYLKGKGLL